MASPKPCTTPESHKGKRQTKHKLSFLSFIDHDHDHDHDHKDDRKTSSRHSHHFDSPARSPPLPIGADTNEKVTPPPPSFFVKHSISTPSPDVTSPQSRLVQHPASSMPSILSFLHPITTTDSPQICVKHTSKNKSNEPNCQISHEEPNTSQNHPLRHPKQNQHKSVSPFLKSHQTQIQQESPTKKKHMPMFKFKRTSQPITTDFTPPLPSSSNTTPIPQDSSQPLPTPRRACLATRPTSPPRLHLKFTPIPHHLDSLMPMHAVSFSNEKESSYSLQFRMQMWDTVDTSLFIAAIGFPEYQHVCHFIK
jgi:hypothetical protein